MKKKIQSTKQNQARSPKKPAKPADVASAKNADGDIIGLILRDHIPLKVLIETLKDADIQRFEKEGPFEEFVPLLVAHARAEEETLYVQMKEFEELRMESFEGDTEHAIAEQLVQEINATPDDDEWNAKVKVLAEMVEHHIEEEEGELLPDVEEKMDLDIRLAVGNEYTQLKTELDALNRGFQRDGKQMNRKTNHESRIN